MRDAMSAEFDRARFLLAVALASRSTFAVSVAAASSVAVAVADGQRTVGTARRRLTCRRVWTPDVTVP
jgi:hypothetical protein